MSKTILTAALACGLTFFAPASNAADDARKEDNASGKSFSGILVDNKCGEKLTTPKHAARHPQTCLKMEECAKTGFRVVVGDKHMKFDDKGNALAKEFIESDDFTTRVVVTGAAGDDGKTIKVTSIKAAPADKKEEKKEKGAKQETDEPAEKPAKTEKPGKADKAEGATKSEK